MGDVVTFVKVMIGEVRIRAHEEEVGLKMLPTLTNKLTASLAATTMSVVPTAVGMEGITRKL
eukprot:9728648-Prorocentrum_lima.AAC.1